MACFLLEMMPSHWYDVFFAITIWDQQNYIESFETLNKRMSVPGAEKEIFQTMLKSS